MIAAFLRRARHPGDLPADLVARVAPGRTAGRQAAAARRVGLDRPRLLVSLDCDTERDIEVAAGVHARFAALGVVPAYAVAGELLQAGADVWREIAATGAEFLNHGGRAHARFDPATGTVSSTLFYDRIARAEVLADVELGHQVLVDLLGRAPTGFRTPHFGTYQRAGELRWLHRELARLGYRYSSSTMPWWGLRRGPVFTSLGLPEIPVTGMRSRPLRPLDSWTCFFAPDRVLDAGDFRREGDAVVGAAVAAGAGLVNLYADPLHVWDSDAYFDAVAAWATAAPPITFGELLSFVP